MFLPFKCLIKIFEREVFIMPKTKYKKRKDGRFQTSITIDGVKQYLIAKTAE